MAWKGKVRHGSIGLFLHFWDKTYMLDVLYIYEFVYQRNHATYIRNIPKMLCFSAKPLSFKWWPVIKSVIKSPVLHPSHRLVVEDIDGVVVAFGVFHTSLSAGRGRMYVCRQLEIQLLHSTSADRIWDRKQKKTENGFITVFLWGLLFQTWYFYLSLSWDVMVRSFWWVAIVESECVCSVGGCKKLWTMLPTAKNLPKKMSSKRKSELVGGFNPSEKY